jgi:hypothetical protein
MPVRTVTRTQLVLDLPTREAIRVVVIDEEAVVDACLALVLRRFGAVLTSGPAQAPTQVLDVVTPRARISEIVVPGSESFAVVQKLREVDAAAAGTIPDSGIAGYLGAGTEPWPAEVGFEMFMMRPADAIELALSIADHDSVRN